MRRWSIYWIAPALCLAAALSICSHSDAADVSGAHDNFVAQCAKCHGESGHGDGPAGAALAIKPRNFSDCTRMAKESDQRLFDTIKGGGASVGLSKDMPPWREAFEDDEIKALVSYVRQFCSSPRAMNK
ncbi:MAG TPA: cytochrome c [Candidatus Binataceae bacterium]|jgi:high-affinity iron transporter|nr:cytochrome c [Candidatus Binataceae bacterium]